MYVYLTPFAPSLDVWCKIHKRWHPLGVACSECLEAVYDAAVVHADPEAPVARSVLSARVLTAGLEVGSLMVQVPVIPEYRRS